MGRIDILAESSLDVTADLIRKVAGPTRLFSIDGGHTTEIALNDLALAEAALADGGVVTLDDAFQSLFPGVAAALAHYMLDGGRLVPFAVSPEKVLLTQPEHHHRLLADTTISTAGAGGDRLIEHPGQVRGVPPPVKAPSMVDANGYSAHDKPYRGQLAGHAVLRFVNCKTGSTSLCSAAGLWVSGPVGLFRRQT